MTWGWIIAAAAAGFAAGALVIGVTIRFHQLDRDHTAYWRGVTDERDGLAPLRPVADLPRNERASVHPALLGAVTVLVFLAAGYTVGGW